VNYLLDTQAWIWPILDPPRLSRWTRSALSAVPDDQPVGLAAIPLKEAAWHLAHGRIVVDESFGPWPLWLRAVSSSPRLQILPLTVDVAIDSEQLDERFPKDADRLIVATARVHDLILITSDRQIRMSGAPRTLW
jgi:PIN domain nuclease of toxin-antitoxin system